MPSTKPKIVIHTNENTIERLDYYAKKERRSRANLAELIILQWLEKQDEKEK